MAWYNSAWQYRKSITISGSSGAGTGYQVVLKIGESSGATGYNFHLNGRSAKFPSAKNDGGDLIFTASDGTTLLNFWVESVSGSSPNRTAVVWVKVNADLGSNQTIYCYYGNANATSASNGNNTFLLFDDFDGTSLDTTKWKTYGSPSIALSNSKLTFYSTSNYSSFCSLTGYTTNTAIRWYAIFGNTTAGYYGQGYGVDKGTSWEYIVSGDNNPTFSVHWETQPNIEAYPSKTSTNNTTTNRPFRTYEIRRQTNGNAVYLINDSQVYSDTSITDTNSYVFGANHYSSDGSANSHVFDYVFIRKYISPEPAFSSSGGEEVILNASIISSSTTNATLRRIANVQAYIGGSCVISALIKLTKGLISAISGATQISPFLAIQKRLASAIEGITQISPFIAIRKSLITVIQSSTSFISDLTIRGKQFLNAIISTSTTFVSNLTAQYTLSSTLSGETQISPFVSIKKALQGSVAGKTLFTGAINRIRWLISNITTQTILTAQLITPKLLSALISGGTSFVGQIQRLRVLTSQVIGQTTIQAQLISVQLLRAVISSTTNISAFLKRNIQMFASFVGSTIFVAVPTFWNKVKKPTATWQQKNEEVGTWKRIK